MHGGDGCVSYNLGQVYMQQQLRSGPSRGSAAGQAYVARYAVGYIGVFEHIWLSAPKCPAGKLPAPIRGLVYVLLARRQDPALAAIRAGQERGGLKTAARTVRDPAGSFSPVMVHGYPRLRYSTVQYRRSRN